MTMSDPKLSALRAAIKRVSKHVTYHDADSVFSDSRRAGSRFVALWQARNRRTRVLMYRAKTEVVLHETVVGPSCPPRIKGF